MSELIEDRVTGILNGVPEFVWDGETLPVPVEDIVDSVFGLRVRVVDDMSAASGVSGPVPAHLSGLLLTGPGEIWVNAEEARQWPGRRRFTISHELGHWVMHRTGQEAVFCRSGVIDPEPVAEPVAGTGGPDAAAPAVEIPPAEAEADLFAASMLMPAHLVEAHYEKAGGDIALLKEQFLSSEKAMKRRVRDVVPEDRWRSPL